MRKTDKKIDKQLREQLTHVCERALKKVKGFQWLTHKVSYADFPNSLQIVCVFDSNENLISYTNSESQLLNLEIATALSAININIKIVKNLIIYDTEERCGEEHDGNWAKRLRV
ncbi:Fis family transcriptional regulator [Thalassotalea fusca]